jgi:hypothetical protein
MPGAIVTLANQVTCSHGGKGTPTPPVGRVQSLGSVVITIAHQYLITGCGYPAATSGAQPPCATGMLVQGSTRVTSMGTPLAILPDSVGTSKGMPNATFPLLILPAPVPPRVTAI